MHGKGEEDSKMVNFILFIHFACSQAAVLNEPCDDVFTFYCMAKQMEKKHSEEKRRRNATSQGRITHTNQISSSQATQLNTHTHT